MATFLTKTLAITGGIGSITAVSFGAVYLTSNKKEKPNTISATFPSTPPEKQQISALLDKKGLKLLETGNSKWTEKWNNFKSKHPSIAPTTPWSFTEWTPAENNENGLNSFKKQCETLGQQSVTDEKDVVYVQVSENCATEKDDRNPK